MNAYKVSQDPVHLFDRARQNGRLQRLKCLRSRSQNVLLDLGEPKSRFTYSQRYEGLRTVSIDSIVGTLGRGKDFDRYFHPLSDRMRDRWISIARARQKETPLGLVSLIRLNENYFVMDGHHRISVARTLGEFSVDAEVIVWEIRKYL